MKKLGLPLLVLVLVGGISAVVITKQMSDHKAPETPRQATASAEQDHVPQETPRSNDAITGRYSSYSAERVGDQAYTTTVLFFHATWCPECRAFKQAINSEVIPANTQVLEVDYDKASDLKKQHGVTLQSTFVKVDQTGKQLAKWVGYGKDKSLQTVLSNL